LNGKAMQENPLKMKDANPPSIWAAIQNNIKNPDINGFGR